MGWCGIVWYGPVRSGLVWYVVRYGMARVWVWYGVVYRSSIYAKLMCRSSAHKPQKYKGLICKQNWKIDHHRHTNPNNIMGCGWTGRQADREADRETDGRADKSALLTKYRPTLFQAENRGRTLKGHHLLPINPVATQATRPNPFTAGKMYHTNSK